MGCGTRLMVRATMATTDAESARIRRYMLVSCGILPRGHSGCDCFLPLAAVRRVERNTRESAECGSDISRGRVRRELSLLDTRAVEDDGDALIVRIERPVRGRARRQNPILTRHDDHVAASPWVVIQRRGPFERIR